MNIAEFLDKNKCHFQRVAHGTAYTSERIAHELHVPGKQVAKTVLLQANGGFRYIVAVLPSSKRLDLGRASSLVIRS
jgi:Ala-tRNA(Pro) deacylase